MFWRVSKNNKVYAVKSRKPRKQGKKTFKKKSSAKKYAKKKR